MKTDPFYKVTEGLKPMLLFAFIPEEDTYIAKDGKRYFDPTCGDSFEVKELTDQNIKLSPPTIKEEEANHGKK